MNLNLLIILVIKNLHWMVFWALDAAVAAHAGDGDSV